ncbi:hypothetical protein ASZ78_004252 [Callipepla squamata]|uniref:Corticotropin-releasing factor-binding protein n=1 Tax=Callipepla squamata TaxID=9009 RepID=A0A226NFD3_CALSU|nr:hypothetical protein ASZ78_004252 [Callipepla squamata]
MPRRLLPAGSELQVLSTLGGAATMPSAFQLQCHLVLILLAASKGDTRYLEVRDAGEDEPFLLLSEDLKRELSAGHTYRRSLRELSRRVFDGWILKGEKFPSSLDHPLPTSQRYTDFCESGAVQRSIRSSQNVAMIFFRIHQPGSGFTVTVKKNANVFLSVFDSQLLNCSLQLHMILLHVGSNDKTTNYCPFCVLACNVISQTPSGRFTMVIPHQHRNCSFSIIYPVVIKISDLILGQLNGLFLKNPSVGCAGVGDFVELLGGTGLDPSKMFPLADLCHSFHGSAQMKIGCDNTVLRMVSSGKHINRVTFEYYQLDLQEIENRKENSIEEFCFPGM